MLVIYMNEYYIIFKCICYSLNIRFRWYKYYVEYNVADIISTVQLVMHNTNINQSCVPRIRYVTN